ncbi:MAG: hypothetical protein OHK0039_18060 [Bacteroidia bacterium]
MVTRNLYTCLAVLFLLVNTAVAQTSDSRWMAGLSATFLDYQGPLTGDYLRVRSYDPGISMAAYAFLNPWMNLSITSSFVPETMYPMSTDNIIGTSLIDANALLRIKSNNGKLLQEDAFLAPYLAAGFGMNTASNNFRMYVPGGLGVRVQVSKNFSIQFESLYKFGLGEGNIQHLQHTAGFVFALPSKPAGGDDEDDDDEEEPRKGKALADRDGDGVPDRDDICPDEKGMAMYLGCPEEVEEEDTVVTPPKPTPPNEPHPNTGYKPAQGPTEIVIGGENDGGSTSPAPAGNYKKMPADQLRFIEEAAGRIYFEAGSDQLTPESVKVLNEVAAILKQYEAYELQVLGHTDNTGDQAKNLILSIKRAFKVKYFLVYEHNIKMARITSDGYSSVAPVSDNGTEEGRRLNRRVEFKVTPPSN